MPLIDPSTYQAPSRRWTYTHLQTIYRSLYRTVEGFSYNRRERIDTPDGDFLDLDWSEVGGDKLLLGLHGLAGSSESTYLYGLLRQFNLQGWDGLAMNYRGCSGEVNRKLRSYHSGETEDIHTILTHLQKNYHYKEIALVGFSLGGNVVMKYSGEQGSGISPLIKRVVAVSAPVDLVSCSWELDRWHNRLYLWRFLRALKRMTYAKQHLLQGEIDLEKVRKSRTFAEFDGAVTAPIHGFESAMDYYTRSSSLPYIPSITIPSLLINARDDSFLGPPCYPEDLARQSGLFHLEVPAHGGHVGFVTRDPVGIYWTDRRIFEFVTGQSD
ncbi:MAG: alpha/beta fold hydrolase [Bacteroidota bacterium]